MTLGLLACRGRLRSERTTDCSSRLIGCGGNPAARDHPPGLGIPVRWNVRYRDTVKIGELGQQAGVSSKTVRYYESIGLLDEPMRTSAGYRDYDEGALERLRFIRSAQATGLSLAEIASVLELKGTGERSCAHTTALLERHLVELEAQISRLRRARTSLRDLANRAHSLDPTACTDPNRCQVITKVGEAIPVSTDSP